jgi:hypothetical protein
MDTIENFRGLCRVTAEGGSTFYNNNYIGWLKNEIKSIESTIKESELREKVNDWCDYEKRLEAWEKWERQFSY